MPDIRTLADDELISEPGFYAISLERHHDQPCDGPSVTSGILRKMELETPADVWAFHKLNPKRWPPKPLTAAIRQGVAMALYVEGGEKAVLSRFKVHPADKPRKPTAAQIEKYDEGDASDAAIASVEYWRAVETSPSQYLTDHEFQMICNMGKVLENDPAKIAMEGIPEITMAWRDEETGLWLLSRPDTVSFDGTVSDYKKMAPSGKPFNYRMVDHRITDMGYDMQLGFACSVYERITGSWPSAWVIAQSDQAPHHIIPREICDEDLRIAEFRNTRAIRTFARCLKNNHWPGPGEDVGIYQRPDWQREMLLEEMNIEGKAP